MEMRTGAMFDCVLIANRGEIACRIVRTCRRLGIRTVAIFSDADEGALHVGVADQAFRIGTAPAAESYLLADRILEAAAAGRAQAIHPGYGFLSENAEFAEACAEAGFVFVGPPADAIRAMGAKSRAKAIMEAAGVPVVPGYHGAAQDDASLIEAARAIGFPVLIKAVAGGGGKGMRIVGADAELSEALAAARREARAAFGDGALLVERYLDRPRHVEVQVFADAHGNAVHLFERDCSLQRRHQKVIEEAPAPDLAAGLRRRLGEAAVAAATAIGYRGAGTVEFLVAPEQGGEAAFHFMEMNTRLQVEHPVTEMITGLDLVEWQLRVAAGEPLPLAQADVAAGGHAFEARIYAENPGRDFLPATGTLSHVRFPQDTVHVRTDTGVRSGDAIGIHYDPLIAKLVVWDDDRASALRRLRRALAEVQIAGPVTNVAFLSAIAGHPAFAAGEVDTGFIPRHRHNLVAVAGPVPPRLLAFACLDVLLRREEEAREAARRSADPYSPWHRTDGWRLNEDNHHVLAFRDGDALVRVTVHYRRDGLLLELPGAEAPVRARGERDAAGDLVADIDGVRSRATVIRAGDTVTVIAGGQSHTLVVDDPAARAELREPQASTLRAPMPGRLVAVHVAPGERVSRGITLVVLEAMKMEHAITAPADGVIAAVPFNVGEQVDDGADLVVFADEGEAP
jgi:3-methylcrotonyl-CoA carboxylase alpha subunit